MNKGKGWANITIKIRIMYKIPKYSKSKIGSVVTFEGETIEEKVERIVNNKEPIKDGAPLIYTERKDGIISGHNIRTDRWEVAAEAMDIVQRSIEAKRENRGKQNESKVIDLKTNKKEDSGAKSIQGNSE